MYHVECPHCQNEQLVEEEDDTILCEECEEIFDYYIDEQGNISTNTLF